MTKIYRLLAASPVMAALLLHPIATVPETVTIQHDDMKPNRAATPAKHDARHSPLRLAKPHTLPVRFTSAQVSGYIHTALQITHEPQSWTRPLYWMAWQESRFYARAVDGVPARLANRYGDAEHAEGLMQVVPSTFDRHAVKGMSDIWNPVDNTAASIRYIAGRYRSPYRIPGIFQVNQYSGY